MAKKNKRPRLAQLQRFEIAAVVCVDGSPHFVGLDADAVTEEFDALEEPGRCKCGPHRRMFVEILPRTGRCKIEEFDPGLEPAREKA